MPHCLDYLHDQDVLLLLKEYEVRHTNIKVNPIALRKAKIAYNFGLSECNRVNYCYRKNWSLLSGINKLNRYALL